MVGWCGIWMGGTTRALHGFVGLVWALGVLWGIWGAIAPFGGFVWVVDVDVWIGA